MMSTETRAAFNAHRASLLASGKFAADCYGSLYDVALRERIASGKSDPAGIRADLDLVGRALGEFEPAGMTPGEVRKWIELMAEHSSYALGLSDLNRAPTIQHYRG